MTSYDITCHHHDNCHHCIIITGNLDTPKWTPRSPLIQFPSKYYKSRHGLENNDWRHDYNNGAIPLHTHEILDKDTPTYSSTDYISGR